MLTFLSLFCIAKGGVNPREFIWTHLWRFSGGFSPWQGFGTQLLCSSCTGLWSWFPAPAVVVLPWNCEFGRERSSSGGSGSFQKETQVMRLLGCGLCGESHRWWGCLIWVCVRITQVMRLLVFGLYGKSHRWKSCWILVWVENHTGDEAAGFWYLLRVTQVMRCWISVCVENHTGDEAAEFQVLWRISAQFPLLLCPVLIPCSLAWPRALPGLSSVPAVPV